MRQAACLLGLLVGACAAPSPWEAQYPVPPRAIFDAYLVAHGMAAGYAARQDADPRVVAELARLDYRALDGLRRLGRDEAAGGAAVSAFADYAARQSVSTQ